MKNSNNFFAIKEYATGNGLTDEFLVDAFNSVESMLFWSPVRRNVYNIDSLLSMFRNQIGDYLLFIAYSRDVPVAIYMAHSISYAHKRAEILVYVKPSERRKIGVFLWWTMFLMEISSREIKQVFGKVFSFNTNSLKAATCAGFEQCGVLPNYVYIDGKPKDAILFSRNTELTIVERKWKDKINQC